MDPCFPSGSGVGLTLRFMAPAQGPCLLFGSKSFSSHGYQYTEATRTAVALKYFRFPSDMYHRKMSSHCCN